MRRLPPLSSLRAFEAAARHQSFKKAAEELGVTPTAISHQIRSLEDILGRPLFERLTRKVVMTESARQLFPPLQQGFDLFATAVERVTAEPERAAVVVTTTTAFAAHWLVPRLSAFRQEQAVTLSVLASDDLVSLEAGKADLALRLLSESEAPREGELLLRDRFAPLASPSLNISDPERLESVPLIRFDWRHFAPNRPDWSKWLEAAGLGHLRVEPRLHFNEESHALQAAIAGQGVALMSLTLADEALRRGLLVRPFATTIPGQSYYLLRARKRSTNARVDAVEDWLREEAARASTE